MFQKKIPRQTRSPPGKPSINLFEGRSSLVLCAGDALVLQDLDYDPPVFGLSLCR